MIGASSCAPRRGEERLARPVPVSRGRDAREPLLVEERLVLEHIVEDAEPARRRLGCGARIEAHRPAPRRVEDRVQRERQAFLVLRHRERDAAAARHPDPRERQRRAERLRVAHRNVLRRGNAGRFLELLARRNRVRDVRARCVEERLLAEALRRKLDDQRRRCGGDLANELAFVELQVVEDEIADEKIVRPREGDAELDRPEEPELVPDAGEIDKSSRRGGEKARPSASAWPAFLS